METSTRYFRAAGHPDDMGLRRGEPVSEVQLAISGVSLGVSRSVLRSAAASPTGRAVAGRCCVRSIL